MPPPLCPVMAVDDWMQLVVGDFKGCIRGMIAPAARGFSGRIDPNSNRLWVEGQSDASLTRRPAPSSCCPSAIDMASACDATDGGVGERCE